MKFLGFLVLCISLVWALPNHNLRKITHGTRIIGGDEARAGQFPWMAAIYKDTEDGRYFCGGALVSDQWVLTAGQCVYDATLFIIQLGSNSLQSTDVNRISLSTSTYVLHDNFDPVTLLNDLGLIQLRLPITQTDYIQIIRVPNMGYIYGGRVVEAAGWGQINDESDLSNELNFVELALISNAECQNTYGVQFIDTMTCATGNFNEGTCFGDIGSPLVTPALVGNRSMLIAVASFVSFNGCESLDPTGYTRADSHAGWITAIINS